MSIAIKYAKIYLNKRSFKLRGGTVMQPDYSDVPADQILCVEMKSFYASIELVKRNIHPLKGYLAGIGDKKRNLEKGNIKDRIESTIGGHKK